MTNIILGPINKLETGQIVRTWSNGTVETTEHNNLSNRHYQKIFGADTRKYNLALRRGSLIPFTSYTNFVSDWESEGSFVGNWTHTSGAWLNITGSNWHGGVLTPGYLDPEASCRALIDPYLESILVQRAAASIDGRSHDMLTSIAELNKARSMFSNLAHKIWNLRVLFFRSVGSNTGREKLEYLYSQWLEGRYGWRTLLYDLQSLNSFVNRVHSKKLVDRLMSEKGELQDTFHAESTGVETFYTGSTMTRTVVTNITHVLNGRVAADYNLALASINPIKTAWELIPYSFVFDWVINVGDAISAASLLALNIGKTCSAGHLFTYTCQRDGVIEPVGTLPGGWSLAISGGYTSVEHAVLKLRSPQEISIMPKYQLRIGAMKVIDLIALIQRAKPVL